MIRDLKSNRSISNSKRNISPKYNLDKKKSGREINEFK